MNLPQKIKFLFKQYKYNVEKKDLKIDFLMDLAKNQKIIKRLQKIKIFDWEELIPIFLEQPLLHSELIQYLYPKFEYINNIEKLGYKYSYHHFMNLKNSDNEYEIKLYQELEKTHSLILKDKENNQQVLALLFPLLNISFDVPFDKIIFISPSIYNYFYKKTVSTSIEKQLSSFKNLLQFMESSKVQGRKINDLHIDPINEAQYVLTARLGEKNQELTKEPILKEDIDKILYEAKIKMGLETEEQIPEVTGIAREILVTEDGQPIERNFRVNLVQDIKNFVPMYSVSIRKLMNSDEIINNGLKGLGYLPEAIKLIEQITAKKYGINVVSGPTNSGKTTLLATILYDLYEKQKRIISIEDPVEIPMPYTQIDLSLTANAEEKFKMTRRKAMKAALRQDPDIVLIGEARDEEIPDFVELGVRGHTAYTTMHTGNITDVILRLLDGTDNPVKVLNSINGIITQMLYDKVCEKCKGKGILNNGETCPICQGSGFNGVVPIYEIGYFKNINVSELLKADGKVDLKKFFDFKTLIENNEMEYISKIEVAEKLYHQGKITYNTLDEIRKTEKDLKGNKNDKEFKFNF